MMTSREIRQSFLDFFQRHGHTIVPSAPAIPHGDPTLMFTNAGMNQFKDVFLGMGSRDYVRAADTQKCIRASGKHNDLEDVGRDTYHHTFFEMLGNWSFGDYYKHEAIAWAWQLLTEVWGLEKDRLHVTVYRADDGSTRDQEAHDIWAAQPGLDPSHIHWFGKADNFWEMGDVGPCGPCSEIHYDRTPDRSGGPLVNAGVPEVIEIWNLVFIQYNRRADGGLDDLPAKHVDTGMGFERICAVLQGKMSNYDSDVFAPLIARIEEISGRTYSGDLADRVGIAMRVLADHVRTLSFAIADGATPGNAGRGYVLRRILRRAVKYAYIDLDIKEPVLYRLVGVLAETMGDVFPELVAQQAYVERIIRAEEQGFGETIEKGVEQFENMVASAAQAVPAADAFLLYDTFGFPLDLTELLARERGMSVDVAGFNTLMDEQKRRARDARKTYHQEATDLVFEGETEFVGYTEHQADAAVVAVTGDGVVLNRTPFYAEMGGQLADTGALVIGGDRHTVADVRKIGSAFLHLLEHSELEVNVGDVVRAEINEERRAGIQRNHSATHIVHEALRRVLGTHVQQAGSLVAPDYLRFDFNHFEKVGEDEIRAIEQMANAKIREAHEVVTLNLPIEEARAVPNVKMFFGDKYGSHVRVVVMDPSFSAEFCGGTHVANTADIGLVKLVSEGSVQSGVRRIEAVTGNAADELLFRRYAEIDRLSKRLGVSDRELYEKVEQLLEEKRTLEKELAEARLAKAAGGLDTVLAAAAEHNGIRIASGRVEATDVDALKAVGDDLRNRLGSGIGMLGAAIDGKATLVCVVTDDLVSRFSAGKIVGAAAKLVGGGGGGKQHMATAGGKNLEALDDVLARVPEIVAGL